MSGFPQGLSLLKFAQKFFVMFISFSFIASKRENETFASTGIKKIA